MDTFNNMKKVVINTLKMLKARGYNTTPYEDYLKDDKLVELYHKDNFELIIEPLKKNMKILDCIHARFSIHGKPSYDDIKSLVSDLIETDSDNEKEQNNNTNEESSSEAEEEIPEILLVFSLPVKGDRFFHNKVQILEYNDLLFNKVDHIFVPKHELIQNPSKIKELVEIYKVPTKWRFPLMYKTDPVSKYYNAKKGDIFKIVRDGIHGESTVYRCVV
jgi:DNA-directed RNA polymerase subunit H (RpoH/RPB5)